MPEIEVKNQQVESRSVQIVIDLSFPPRIIDGDGSVTYGKISHIESKGVDENGDAAGNIYWAHEEVPQETKQKLVGILLTDLPPLLAAAGVSVDLTPTVE